MITRLDIVRCVATADATAPARPKEDQPMRRTLATFAATLVATTLLAAGSTSAFAQAAPAAPSAGLAAAFARADQTVEYHVMIAAPAMKEADVAAVYEAAVVKPLAVVAEVGALKKPKPGIYVDDRAQGLEKKNLIVRVRQGQITVKARASSPDVLLDLAACSAKKYEMDWFGTPDYSISSDIKFKDEEFDVKPAAWTPPKLWAFMGTKCPDLMKQIGPAVAAAPAIEIPGVASMYSAEVKLKHPKAADLAKAGLEAGVAVWFFPPTDRYLVELAFTGNNANRAASDKMYADILAELKKANLLAADQTSKTQQYFAAYFGAKK